MSKEFADLADKRVEELRAQGDFANAAKWPEGGTYRVAGHSAIGALGGGVNGALGSCAAAAAAPTLSSIQNALQGRLMDAGVNGATAQDMAKLLSGTVAGGIGAAVGGGAGTATALNEDFYNRQLHSKESAYGLKIQNHFADIVVVFNGGNPSTGGFIPEGSSLLMERLNVVLGDVTVHNCYGYGGDGCANYWSPNAGQENLIPINSLLKKEKK